MARSALVPILLSLAAVGPMLAQQSASFKHNEHTVNAENLLSEEGTKGLDSNASERPTPAPCP